MSEKEQSSKRYDLEERTLEFAKAVRTFVKLLPRSITNQEDVRQLVRSSGSVGANYIEANDALRISDLEFPFCLCQAITRAVRFRSVLTMR